MSKLLLLAMYYRLGKIVEESKERCRCGFRMWDEVEMVERWDSNE